MPRVLANAACASSTCAAHLGRQVRARDDAVRHAASFIRYDLQPARFLDGIGGIVIRIDVHELQHVDVFGIAQQIAKR